VLESRRGSTELQRARELRPLVESVDYLLDIHSMQHDVAPLMIAGLLPKGRAYCAAIGTTEFVVVGLLPTIGADLGVAPSTAGLLVTGYAIGLAIGGPLLTYLTRRVPRRTVLIGLMVGFAGAHIARPLEARVPGPALRGVR